MDGSAPKINVAPSSDNTTPEAIKPTVTEQAAAQPTLASAASDDLVEIEGSVGEQNPLVEELDVASPSLAPPLHSPSVTQPGAAGEDEVKVQESTQVEGDANVEVPIPNTLAYEPPPQPSLDSDAINAARVKKEDDDEDSEEEVADYEDLEPAEDSEVTDPSDTAQDELEKNQAMIEEMRAKHVEEEQAKVQEKIKAVMAEIELKTAAELKEKEEKSKSSEGETINTDAVEEPEPFSVEPMTTPPPPTVKEVERNAASANVEELSQSENVHENEVEDERVDSQPAVNTDDQVEPVVDPEKLHNQAEQGVHDSHHAVHNHDHIQHPGQGQGLGHGHEDHTDFHVQSQELGHGRANGHGHDHGHGHNHGHGHDHGHGPDHGHGHSHDHEGHDHSHGIGHLGRKPSTPRPEVLPESYKPAEQEFELPLSARYGSPNQFAAPASGFEQPSVDPQFGAPSSTNDHQNVPLNSLGSQFGDQGSYSDDQKMDQFENEGDMIPSNLDEHVDLEHPSLYQDPSLQTQAPDSVEYQYTPAPDVTDYQYTPAPDADGYQYTEAPEVDQNNQIPDGDIDQYNQDPNVVLDSQTQEEVPKVAEEEGPGLFERISNYFSGWGSKEEEALKEAMNTPPENPSWEENRQGRLEKRPTKGPFWAWQISHGPQYGPLLSSTIILSWKCSVFI